ncbi:MAG: hypothetical protein MI745_06710, partial [Pseudomonadales bacterium]|nr:hypothetical protein [Pseudomonadales bacterium]
ADKAKAEQDAAELAAARVGAAMAVGFTSQLLEAKYPYVQIDDKQKENLIDKAAPVLKKYHYEPPPWMKKYQEEIDLGVAIGTAGFSVYVQVQKHKADEQRRIIEERRRRAQQQTGAAPQPAGRVDFSQDDNGAAEGDAKRVDAA